MLNDHDHSYFARVRSRFAESMRDPNARLFTTSATRKGILWAAYLGGFPEGPVRQQHNCNTCRSFIERYGSLVTIEAQRGVQWSAVWDASDAPSEYQPSIDAMLVVLAQTTVTGVYIPGEQTLGTPEAGGWEHFSVTVPAHLVHTSRIKTAGQRRAELREDFGIIQRALQEFTAETVATAVGLLKSGNALYRAEKVLGVAEWFQSLYPIGGNRNLLWRAVALAPTGFAHVKSSMIGTLLEDIQKGLTFVAVQARFAEKMKPSNYQRAQAAPTVGAIERAEKLIADLGLQTALMRRYATLSEVMPAATWAPAYAKGGYVAAAPTGVFGHIAPRDAVPAVAPLVAPAQTMTWEKFQRTILPTARTLEALVPASDNRFVALVAPADPAAPPILQWDNQMSWYYASGMDAEMRRRVTGAGGQYDNVDIRASLLWDNRNDLDLHVTNPSGRRIYYGDKRDRFGGFLDVDMNVQGETNKPVENTRWPRGTAPDGQYGIAVWNYRHHEMRRDHTPFRVEIEAGGIVKQFHGVVPANSTQELLHVATLIKHGAEVTITPYLQESALTRPAGVNEWNLTPGSFVPVRAIVPSPNQWGDAPMPQHGAHTFFLLNDCRDTSSGVGRGFFTETLRGELREVRSTLEAYTATATIAGAADATACGIGMNDATPWDLTLRVNGGATYRIDRKD